MLSDCATRLCAVLGGRSSGAAKQPTFASGRARRTCKRRPSKPVEQVSRLLARRTQVKLGAKAAPRTSRPGAPHGHESPSSGLVAWFSRIGCGERSRSTAKMKVVVHNCGPRPAKPVWALADEQPGTLPVNACWRAAGGSDLARPHPLAEIWRTVYSLESRQSTSWPHPIWGSIDGGQAGATTVRQSSSGS